MSIFHQKYTIYSSPSFFSNNMVVPHSLTIFSFLLYLGPLMEYLPIWQKIYFYNWGWDSQSKNDLKTMSPKGSQQRIVWSKLKRNCFNPMQVCDSICIKCTREFESVVQTLLYVGSSVFFLFIYFGCDFLIFVIIAGIVWYRLHFGFFFLRKQFHIFLTERKNLNECSAIHWLIWEW